MRVPPPVSKSTTPVIGKAQTAVVGGKSAEQSDQRPAELPVAPLRKADRPAAQSKPGNALDLRVQKGKPDVGPVEPGAPALRPAVERMVSDGKVRFATAGYAGIDAHITELERIGTTSRMNEAARALFDLELRLLQTQRGGDGGIAARLSEIDNLFLVALMTPEQSQALTEEHIALKGLREAFAPLQARAADIENVERAGNLGPTDALAYAVERTALNGLIDGAARLEATRRDAENQLASRTLDPAAARQAGLVVNVTTAAQGGSAGIEARIAVIANTRTVARLTAEGSETLAIEEKVLASLLRELQKI
jgi:hypothetical protein